MLKRLVAGALALGAISLLVYFYQTKTSNGTSGVSSIVVDRSLPRANSFEARRIPAKGTVCVGPIQNTSSKKIALTALEDELAAQLRLNGFEVMDPGGVSICTATVHTELVSIEGRGPLKATVDFRVALSDDQIPRLVTSASGKSTDGSTKLAGVNSFAPVQPDRAAMERAAIVAAFASEARLIQAAQKDGMQPYGGAKISDH